MAHPCFICDLECHCNDDIANILSNTPKTCKSCDSCQEKEKNYQKKFNEGCPERRLDRSDEIKAINLKVDLYKQYIENSNNH